jgi:hypothetical protein
MAYDTRNGGAPASSPFGNANPTPSNPPPRPAQPPPPTDASLPTRPRVNDLQFPVSIPPLSPGRGFTPL